MVSTIGLIGVGGTLGLPLALVLSKAGYAVSGIDNNVEKIQRLSNAITKGPRDYIEPQINEYLEYAKARDFMIATGEYYGLLRDCEVVFIIVQTPPLKSGELDIKYVRSALEKLHEVNPNSLAIISSTLNIGDMEKLQKIHRRVCYNPEFVARGTIIEDFENPKFILIGTFNKDDALIIKRIWEKVTTKGSYIFNPTEAEIVKLSSNLSLTLQMNFANVIGTICDNFNADSNKVLHLLYSDIRNYKAGLGAGGPCFNKDLQSLIATCDKSGVEAGGIFTAFLLFMNAHWIEYYYDKITSHKKKRIGFLGVAYKSGVPYLDNSQALEIAKRLAYEGYEIYVFDQLAGEEVIKDLKKYKVFLCSTKEECLDRSQVIFIGASNFKTIDTEKLIVNPWS